MVIDAVHLHDSCNLSIAQKTELESFIRKYAHVFMLPGTPFRGVTNVEHSIENGDAKPQYTTPYSHSPAQLNLIKHEIHKMLEQNILEPSTSPWGAPCLLVKKKTEHGLQVAPCLVWDYRKLNKVTKPDVYPLPHVQMILDQLGGKTWFTKLDLFSGFWHILIASQDKEKTAVITHVGLYQFEKLPFGLHNVPASFQRLMNCTFADMLFPADEQPYLSTYVDDILCHSTNWPNHLIHLERVLARCDKVGLSLKPSKCSFTNHNQEFLGYVISEQGREPASSKIESVASFPQPTCKSDVQNFFGLARYIIVNIFQTLQQPRSNYLRTKLFFIGEIKSKKNSIP